MAMATIRLRLCTRLTKRNFRFDGLPSKRFQSTTTLPEVIFKFCVFLNPFKSNVSLIFDREKVEEIQIKFPWGHVAGKWWGPKNVRPIVSLHGWQDNAGKERQIFIFSFPFFFCLFVSFEFVCSTLH